MGKCSVKPNVIESTSDFFPVFFPATRFCTATYLDGETEGTPAFQVNSVSANTLSVYIYIFLITSKYNQNKNVFKKRN